ncbi:hypothetical protein [Mycolicibacterium sp.]|nr:hypothetical protein [Mycolicibacterium sp.]MBJ7337038.1 hypothetical protein [Mycolicibacterium sp.]
MTTPDATDSTDDVDDDDDVVVSTPATPGAQALPSTTVDEGAGESGQTS